MGGIPPSALVGFDRARLAGHAPEWATNSMLLVLEHLPQIWQTAVRGALTGDALGVPHEFKSGAALPPTDRIEMVMPGGYPKTYSGVGYGHWSDDGSQLLALLDSLQPAGHYDEKRFTNNLLEWLSYGRFQAGGKVFDVGAQTRAALEDRAAGRPLRPMNPGRVGNGSLMRVLPAATLPDTFGVSRNAAIRTAMEQSAVTHPQPLAKVTCALYVELCWAVAEHPGALLSRLVGRAEEALRERGVLSPTELQALGMLMGARKEMPSGSGYVVSTLWSAVSAVERATSLSQALRNAVSLGNDTDTVACVAGGLAGLKFGSDPLAEGWWRQMELRCRA